MAEKYGASTTGSVNSSAYRNRGTAFPFSAFLYFVGGMPPRFLLFIILLATPALADDYVQSIEAWRAGRIQRLQRPEGWLALIGRHPLGVGTWTVGSAEGNTLRLAAGPGRLGTINHAP